MSRILQVIGDDRPIPANAVWWRKRLQFDPDHILYTVQLHVPEGWAFEYDPWSYHIDYYEPGQNEWSWPYAAKLHTERETRDIYDGSLYAAAEIPTTTIVLSQHVFLDVFDVAPPGAWGDSRFRWHFLTDEICICMGQLGEEPNCPRHRKRGHAHLAAPGRVSNAQSGAYSRPIKSAPIPTAARSLTLT